MVKPRRRRGARWSGLESPAPNRAQGVVIEDEAELLLHLADHRIEDLIRELARHHARGRQPLLIGERAERVDICAFALRAAILMAARPWSGEPHCDRAGNTGALQVEDCRRTKIVKLGPARSSP